MGIRISRKDSHKFSVFVLTFMSYACFHANRKAFSNVKASTEKVWTPSFHNETVPELKPDNLWNAHHMFDDSDDVENYQGVLDTVFMLAYAVGLFTNGYIGDRVNMRILLSCGMAGTSVMIFLFGCVFEWLTFYNKYVYAIVWILNGLLQSTGWPVVVACMGNWFGKSSRGVLLGLWSSCASVGNIIGALLVSSVLSYGYEYAFLVTSTVLLSMATMVFFGLVPCPEDVGYEPVKEEDEDEKSEDRKDYSGGDYVDREPLLAGGDSAEDSSIAQNDTWPTQNDTGDQSEENEVTVEGSPRPVSLSLWRAALLPGVMPYSLAYAFLKLVNYSFFFWLPLYLNSAFKWEESEADRLSTAYDIAGIISGTIVGFVSDRLGKRTILIFPMLIISIPGLFIYANSPNDRVVNTALMSFVGFLVGGAANLISAAVSADLGCQKAIRGNDKALASVTGIIDGTGSFGAAIGQLAVPHLQTSFGWHSVFYLFMVCMFLTAVCLLPLFVKEVMSYSWCARLLCQRRRTLIIQEDSDE